MVVLPTATKGDRKQGATVYVRRRMHGKKTTNLAWWKRTRRGRLRQERLPAPPTAQLRWVRRTFLFFFSLFLHRASIFLEAPF